MNALSHIDWREPLWLWLALLPWLSWLGAWLLHRPRGAGYADPRLLPWARARAHEGFTAQRLWRHALMAGAWVLFALALAGPRVAETRYDQQAPQRPELMVILDLSRSMTARDVAPSRLERAKLELHDLLARAEGMRIGLVIYAGRAHLMVPPTDDKAALRYYLQMLEHGVLPTEGSNLKDAIALAADGFTSAESPRALLLISDGEIPEGAASAAAVEAAVGGLRQRGIALHVLGVGTHEGAALFAPDGGWLRHEGQAVHSKLREGRLRALAAQGNGRYAAVSDSDTEWRRLYGAGIRRLHAAADQDQGLIVWRELYAWPLVPAVLLLLLAHARGERRRHARRSGATLSSLTLMSVLAAGLAGGPTAHAAEERLHEQAYAAYATQSYREAERLYRRVPGYAGRLGEASSAYRRGEYQRAIALFTQAALDAADDAQRARALFNLANAHYRLEDYATAEEIYRDVLRYQAAHRAAEVNLGYAVAMREQQEREQASRDDEAGAARQGRGPRAVTPPEGTDVSRGDLRLSEDEPPPEPAGDTGGRPRSDAPGRRFEASRPAVRQATEFDDPTWRYEPVSPGRIALQAESLEVDQAVLWRRIFESAEGFHAPVDNPQVLPDMPPW